MTVTVGATAQHPHVVLAASVDGMRGGVGVSVAVRRTGGEERAETAAVVRDPTTARRGKLRVEVGVFLERERARLERDLVALVQLDVVPPLFAVVRRHEALISVDIVPASAAAHHHPVADERRVEGQVVVADLLLHGLVGDVIALEYKGHGRPFCGVERRREGRATLVADPVVRDVDRRQRRVRLERARQRQRELVAELVAAQVDQHDPTVADVETARAVGGAQAPPADAVARSFGRQRGQVLDRARARSVSKRRRAAPTERRQARGGPHPFGDGVLFQLHFGTVRPKE
mmetsp:Transcript_96428/g.274899  ORF Transcript_96428/g.274899 Transcript_96428/m.274899 type:complete len:289 (-) Transcript_96428:1294-2160(-)